MTGHLPAACPTCGAAWEYVGPAGRECARHHSFLLEDLVAITMGEASPAPPHPDLSGPAPAYVGHPRELATLGILGGQARLVRLADVTPTPVSWLWPGYLPLGKLAVLDGDPGLGKSSVTLDLAARVSTAQPLPDGAVSDLPGPGGVVLLSAEDGLADTIRPRLEAAGADVQRVVALTGVADVSPGSGEVDVRPPTIADLDPIEEAIHRVAARLVIVDPFMAYLADQVRSFQDQSVRRALAPLAELAERRGVVVLVVRHLNKSGGDQALYRGGGSIGIVGAARAGLLIAADPDDPARRILASVKSNLAQPPPALAYRLVEAPNRAVRVEWLGTTTHTANQLLAMPAGVDAPGPQAEALAFLREVLADGPVAASEVQQQARAAGISPRTLNRAKQVAGVRAARVGGVGAGGSWSWSLAKVATPALRLPSPGMATLGEVGPLSAVAGRPGPVYGAVAPSPEGRG
jgi:hypothetical protein